MSMDPVTAAMRIARVHTGPVISQVPGRTDRHEVDVPPESYVIPADVVSALGEGNTLAGMKVIARRFGIPEAPNQKLARGGVPVVIAGGEVVLPPEVVRREGNGDMKRGHEALSKWVLAERQKHIKTLKSLPKPVR